MIPADFFGIVASPRALSGLRFLCGFGGAVPFGSADFVEWIPYEATPIRPALARLKTHGQTEFDTVPHLRVGLPGASNRLVKSYSSSQTETRYSPAQITGAEKIARFGSPDMDHVSTSYSGRLNLSVRMHNRRFTRLTNVYSKSAEHHAAMVALFVAFYNICRRHETLKKQTPAMAAGLADRPWTIADSLAAVA